MESGGGISTQHRGGRSSHNTDDLDRQRSSTGTRRMDTTGLARHMATPRTVSTLPPDRQLSTQSTSSEVSTEGVTTPLGAPPSILDRSVSQQQPVTSTQNPGQLPDSGALDLAGGGKVYFTRNNGGDLPLVKDELLGLVDDDEKSGALDHGKASKLKKFISGMNTALDFMMHNRKFQTGVGLLGIGVCVGVGCVFPVALVAAGPFIIIFANGFIDNPMITGPEPTPPKQKNEPNEDPNKKTNNNDEDSSKPAPPKPDDGDGNDPPTPGGPTTKPSDLDKKRRQEEEDRKKAEELEEELQKKLRRQGINTHSTIVPKQGVNGTLDLLQQQAQFENQYKTDLERFKLDEFLDGEDGFKAGSDLHNALLAAGKSTQEIKGLRDSVEQRVNFLIANFQFDRITKDQQVRAKTGVDLKERLYIPKPDELLLLKKAIIREAATELVDYVQDNHDLPEDGNGVNGRMQTNMTSDHLFARAANNIGLPFAPQEDRLISYLLPAQCATVINDWFDGKIASIVKKRKIDDLQQLYAAPRRLQVGRED